MKLTSMLALAGLAFAPALDALAEKPEQGGKPLSTTLRGEDEAPGPGDVDGTGTAEITLNPGQAQVCWDLTVENIATATAAHIHQAPAGEPGPVVVALSAPADGSSDGCGPTSRSISPSSRAASRPASCTKAARCTRARTSTRAPRRSEPGAS